MPATSWEAAAVRRGVKETEVAFVFNRATKSFQCLARWQRDESQSTLKPLMRPAESQSSQLNNN